MRTTATVEPGGELPPIGTSIRHTIGVLVDPPPTGRERVTYHVVAHVDGDRIVTKTWSKTGRRWGYEVRSLSWWLTIQRDPHNEFKVKLGPEFPYPMSRLPEREGDYLVWNSAEERYVCLGFSLRGGWIGLKFNSGAADFTHWRPMPEGPSMLKTVRECFDDLAETVRGG